MKFHEVLDGYYDDDAGPFRRESWPLHLSVSIDPENEMPILLDDENNVAFPYGIAAADMLAEDWEHTIPANRVIH